MSNQNDAINLLAGTPSRDPTPEQFCLEVGLYDAKPKAACLDTLATLRFDPFQFDAHCIWCKKTSTFHAKYQPYRPGNRIEEAKENGPFNRSVKCARADHFYTYYFYVFTNTVVKVGQYPSIQDIAGSDLKRFAAVLDKVDYGELTRATGLFSHGIGIGSFVYLRRIFERMIEAHRVELHALGETPEGFETMRMEEKIAALARVLPPSLVKNRAVYGVLSMGIHALSEEQCLDYFPVVRAAIIQILEQDLEQKNKERATADLEREVATLQQKLRSPSQ